MEKKGRKVKENIVKNKSFTFALNIVKISQTPQQKNERVLSKQLLRSGTSIGALVREAEHAESKADFIHKMSIAIKEANETDYWIELLHKSNLLANSEYVCLHDDVSELIRLLTSIIKTTKSSHT